MCVDTSSTNSTIVFFSPHLLMDRISSSISWSIQFRFRRLFGDNLRRLNSIGAFCSTLLINSCSFVVCRLSASLAITSFSTCHTTMARFKSSKPYVLESPPSMRSIHSARLYNFGYSLISHISFVLLSPLPLFNGGVLMLHILFIISYYLHFFKFFPFSFHIFSILFYIYCNCQFQIICVVANDYAGLIPLLVYLAILTIILVTIIQ